MRGPRLRRAGRPARGALRHPLRALHLLAHLEGPGAEERHLQAVAAGRVHGADALSEHHRHDADRRGGRQGFARAAAGRAPQGREPDPAADGRGARRRRLPARGGPRAQGRAPGGVARPRHRPGAQGVRRRRRRRGHRHPAGDRRAHARARRDRRSRRLRPRAGRAVRAVLRGVRALGRPGRRPDAGACSPHRADRLRPAAGRGAPMRRSGGGPSRCAPSTCWSAPCREPSTASRSWWSRATACTTGHQGRVAELAAAIAAATDLDGDLRTGYEILAGIEFPWPVAEVVVRHHERLDGSGYPAGLSSAAIRLEARILAVADVVEAMSSHRPYRSALGPDSGLEEIAAHRGVLYDGDVADACRALFEDGFSFSRAATASAAAAARLPADAPCAVRSACPSPRSCC